MVKESWQRTTRSYVMKLQDLVCEPWNQIDLSDDDDDDRWCIYEREGYLRGSIELWLRTWTRMHWQELLKRLSTAHLTAKWLFLLLSMAMTVEADPSSSSSIEDNEPAIFILLPAPPRAKANWLEVNNEIGQESTNGKKERPGKPAWC